MLYLRYGQGANGVPIRERLLLWPDRGSLQRSDGVSGKPAGREGISTDASGGGAAPAPGGET